MREIKFRAWDPIEKKMWYPDAVSKEGRGMHCAICWQTDWKYDPIMQCTGLKDKNGKEIYDSDLVKCRPFGEELVCQVVVNLPVCGLLFENGVLPLNVARMDIAEIIGNIYENPELLKEKKV